MTVVVTNSVKVAKGCEPTERDIKKIIPILQSQGLIEPLKMNKNGEIGLIDPYDSARLEACKRLNWPTVIVAFDC